MNYRQNLITNEIIWFGFQYTVRSIENKSQISSHKRPLTSISFNFKKKPINIKHMPVITSVSKVYFEMMNIHKHDVFAHGFHLIFANLNLYICQSGLRCQPWRNLIQKNKNFMAKYLIGIKILKDIL